MEIESQHPVHARIAANLHALRAAHNMSLEALAQASGVSRSALSLIERGQSSPTAVVLDKIAVGLGVSLADLFASKLSAPTEMPTPLSRHVDQVCWTDPGSGYLRRALSPVGFASPIQLVEVHFPPGARVAFETGPRNGNVHQQVWILEGELTLTVGNASWNLATGDCLAMALDQPTAFHNPSRQTTRYAVALATDATSRKN